LKFSASMIKTYMDCPLQAHFKEVLRIDEPTHAKTVFGSCIHEALEVYNHTGDIEKAKEHFRSVWVDPGLLHHPQEIGFWGPKMTWGELDAKGREFLDTFHEESRWEKRKIIGIEHRFEVPFGTSGEHTLKGFVDCIEEVGSGQQRELRIIDYKTSSYRPTHLELRFNVQMTCYIWASLQPEFWASFDNAEEMHQRYLNAKRRGIWYSIWHGKTLDVGPREEVDFMRLNRVVNEIAHAREMDVHVPDISGESCMWCSYTDLCAVTLPLEHVVLEARNERLR
jgi:CRISPR/Cas system-associated exonuclease Cas4 (RecB family)